MKEYIDILDKNGNAKQAEIVFRMQDEESKQCYIVYEYSNEYFAAKYNDVLGTSALNTNLNAKELAMLEEALNEIPEV